MLMLNLDKMAAGSAGRLIQIQPMLMLNVLTLIGMKRNSTNSNTTYVNVKPWAYISLFKTACSHSNTTYVNVKHTAEKGLSSNTTNSNTTYVNVKRS